MIEWFDINSMQALAAILSTACVYGAILVYTRIFGLRSFSKMTNGDFAMTIAVGSLFGATIATPDPSVPVALVALLALFAVHSMIAHAQRKGSAAAQLLSNAPLLLMDGPNILHHNLAKANVSESDLRAKLREANVLRLEQVAAVVFETTGDVSVLHGDTDCSIEAYLLDDVRKS